MSQRIIKKYPNRRLYDTTLRTYITLDDVKNLVFDHVQFQIIDARSNKDLTQSTLLQIISEQEASSTPIFTSEILQDLIRFYHEKSQHLFTQYLEQAMSLFMQQRNFFQHQWLTYNKIFANPDLLEKALMPGLKESKSELKESKPERKAKKVKKISKKNKTK
jgi:polyhydroxyalkanoate synthesis repressor PhaR